MKKSLMAIVAMSMLITYTMAEDTPMNPGDVLMPSVIDSGRDMIHLYPSIDTVVLPELSKAEEQKIVDLIEDKSRTYVAVKRDVSVAVDNWELVGSKGLSDIWQLHIKSPGAIAVQAFFFEATLFSGLDIKVYSGEEGITSHIGEHQGNNSDNAESFWSTKVPGNTIVIEAWVPQERALAPDSFPFEVKYINHYFRAGADDVPTLNYFTVGTSQQNNTCTVFNDLCDFGDGLRVYSAVSFFLYTNSDGDTSQCTGTFLNNGPSTGTELYLLTAFHCIYPGSSQNMVKGTDINAQVETSLSPCANANDQLVGNDIKFIAGSEKADWALLWVNKNTLSRRDGQNIAANTPALLGWNARRLASGSSVETLHHADGTDQNYARYGVIGLSYARGQAAHGDRTSFEFCRNTSGCTHYNLEAVIGGTEGGASGASFWGPRYLVRAVLTHGDDEDACDATASRFDKMYEDGRFKCALNEGAAYYPNNTSTCDDSARPSYTNSSGSGGGGGSVALWLIALLILSLLCVPIFRRKLVRR